MAKNVVGLQEARDLYDERHDLLVVPSKKFNPIEWYDAFTGYEGEEDDEEEFEDACDEEPCFENEIDDDDARVDEMNIERTMNEVLYGLANALDPELWLALKGCETEWRCVSVVPDMIIGQAGRKRKLLQSIFDLRDSIRQTLNDSIDSACRVDAALQEYEEDPNYDCSVLALHTTRFIALLRGLQAITMDIDEFSKDVMGIVAVPYIRGNLDSSLLKSFLKESEAPVGDFLAHLQVYSQLFDQQLEDFQNSIS